MKRAISQIRVLRRSPRPAVCFVGVAVPALFESTSAEMPLWLAQDRLQKAFDLAFNHRLPLHAQASLRAFWKSSRAYDDGRLNVPPVIIVEPAGSPLIGTNALAATNGIDFHLPHPLVATAPDEILSCVLVHELAHAFLRVRRQQNEDEDVEEAAARTVVLAWGGDEDAVDRWAGENALLLAI